jgi:hypothetical protein
MQFHDTGLDSICYPFTTSKSLTSLCYREEMPPDELQTFRAKRLDALVEKLGSNNELGRRLGMANGTFIGQMRRGERAITEKFIAKVTAKIRGTAGWFDPPTDPEAPSTIAAEERAPFATEADHMLASVLYIGRQLEGLDDYRRNAVGQLLLGLAKDPAAAAGIAEDIQALVNSRGKMAA